MGIDLNPEYIKLIENRLSLPFYEFDSIDKRFERVPNDLYDKQVRMNYVSNHIHCFLKNHNNSIGLFIESVI